MSGSLQPHSNNLERLARARFPALTASEIRLLRAAPNEDQVALGGPSNRDDDRANDPSAADKWGRERQIRAELIRWLCVDKKARSYVDPQGIRIFAAKIVDLLNLSYVTVPFPLILWRCALTDVSMRSEEIPKLDLSGCWLQSLDAQGARVKGDVFLRDHFRTKGTVLLMGAQIGGDLDCSGGSFINPPMKKSSDTGVAIAADGITVGGQVSLSTFSPSKRPFHAEGEVDFLHAQIGMNFDCRGGVFINPTIAGIPASGNSLSADGINVKGTVFLNKDVHSVGFYSEGEVRLVDAQIGGSLECQGGTFLPGLKRNADGSIPADNHAALTAERANIKGDVFFCNSVLAGQPVSYRGTVIFGKFRAEGAVSLAGARIEGNLDLRKSLLEKTELVLERTSVGSFMYSLGNWPQRGNLFLDGFVYGRIADGPADAETMLNWLSLQPEQSFRPQPFLQLAKVLRESGDDDGERRVLVAMEDQRWKADHPSISILRLPFKLIAGYGYRPLWAAWEILGLSALGWIIIEGVTSQEAWCLPRKTPASLSSRKVNPQIISRGFPH